MSNSNKNPQDKKAKPKNPSTAIRKAKLLNSLEKHLGIVTDACIEAGVSRFTYYDWYGKDEEFKKAVDEMENIAHDCAESSLLSQIKEGVTSATIFYLKTKVRHRGYVEKQEININGNVDVSQLSDEELRKIAGH